MAIKLWLLIAIMWSHRSQSFLSTRVGGKICSDLSCEQKDKSKVVDGSKRTKISPLYPMRTRDLVKLKRSSGGSGPKTIMPQGQPRQKAINNPSKLKIIGGVAKGRKIDSPDVYLRPMMAKVREALFSTLENLDLFSSNTTRVLDMFSGSGSVGLEALSRGCSHSTFVDLSDDCIKTSLRNAASLNFGGQVSSVCARAEDVLCNPQKHGLTVPYNLISITPPYKEVSYPELIKAVSHSPLVQPDTIVIIEYPVEMGTLPHILEEDKLFGLKNRKYGRTVIAMYVYRPNKNYAMNPEEFLSLKRS